MDVIGVVVAAALLVVVQCGRPAPTLRAWWVWTLVAAASTSVVIGGWLAGALVIGALAVTMRGPWVLRTVGGYCAAYAIYVSLRDTHPLYGVWYLLTISAIGLLLYVLTRLAIVVRLAQARRLCRLQSTGTAPISRYLHDILRSWSRVSCARRPRSSCWPAPGSAASSSTIARRSDGQNSLRGLTGATVWRPRSRHCRDLFDRPHPCYSR